MYSYLKSVSLKCFFYSILFLQGSNVRFFKTKAILADTVFLIKERKVLNEAIKSHRSRAKPGTCLFDPCSELQILSCSYFEKGVEDLRDAHAMVHNCFSSLSFLILILDLNWKV